ncbi:MAG: hypothetical protein ACJ75J_06420 [Cytophagaceae bacterium]
MIKPSFLPGAALFVIVQVLLLPASFAGTARKDISEMIPGRGRDEWFGRTEAAIIFEHIEPSW